MLDKTVRAGLDKKLFTYDKYTRIDHKLLHIKPFNDQQVLRKFLRNILLAASERKINSVAIPAIGTGTLKFPPEIVFDCLIQESMKFSTNDPKSSIYEIRLVVFDQVIFDVRKNVFTLVL